MATEIDNDRAMALRVQALGLLQQAAALDKLELYVLTHRHGTGEATHLVWSAEPPDESDAALVVSDFDPDREDEIAVGSDFKLEDVCGVAMTARLDAIREAQPDDDGATSAPRPR